ncbi:MAG: hypothetical protein RQ875_13220 [Vicingaceae bacterium]|nr:hypothetical protein [Vicingaceae bacterium]
MKNICKKTDLTKNFNIELEHIQLEIKHQRGQHLRHFIDQYFCYKKGYVTKSGKPAWKKIFWNECVSVDAEKNGGKVVKEHIVPISVIKDMLLKLGPNATIKDIQKILDDFVMFATITKDEDKKLNDAGLKSKMPDTCYVKNNELKEGFDKFARHTEVGIELNC